MKALKRILILSLMCTFLIGCGEARGYSEARAKSADVSTVDSIINAIEICGIDPEIIEAGEWELVITISKKGTKYVDLKGDSAGKLDTVMEKTMASLIPQTTSLEATKVWGGALQIIATPVKDGYGRVNIKMPTSSGDYTVGNKAFAEFSNHNKIDFS